jgi:hypothetical protein
LKNYPTVSTPSIEQNYILSSAKQIITDAANLFFINGGKYRMVSPVTLNLLNPS